MHLPQLNKCTYSPEMLAALNLAQQEAADAYGVARKFLHFATPEFMADPQEQYGLHNYCTITAAGIYTKLVVSYDEQIQNALQLRTSGHLWSEPASIIVVNSPNYLFDGSAKEPDKGAEGFIAHLLCSLAYRAMILKSVPFNIAVNYLGTAQLDYSKEYRLNPRHLLIWGPVSDHFNSYDYNKTIQFLHTFHNYTRILITSTKDIGELLGKLSVNVTHISHFFNFDSNREEEPVKKRTVKAKKEEKVESTDTKKKPRRANKANSLDMS